VALLAGGLVGCPAVFPELGTRTRALPTGQPLDPPPPEGLRWLRVLSARIPEKSRGGRPWQADGKFADPYVKVFINGKEIFRTAVQPNTLEPTWKEGPKGNFKFGAGDKLGIELLNSHPINDEPICVQAIGDIGNEALRDKRIDVRCEGGAEVGIAFEEAHAVLGAGLWYELRLDTCFITRLLHGSPAEREGLLPGDQILEISGRGVQTMTANEIRSTFNAIPVNGLSLKIKHRTGAPRKVTLKEGPIYPLYEQFGAVD
jgi:hypothetical protein